MKRQWRVGRIILAVLLLSLAGIAFYVWPMGPRWRIEREHVVGFDLKRNLLFTADVIIDEHCQIHGYDLVTGERKYSTTLAIEKKNRNRVDMLKEALFSADCNRMVLWHLSDDSLQVFDVGNPWRLSFSITIHRAIECVRFSEDGNLLAFRDDDGVQIWDCRSHTLFKRLTLPREVEKRAELWNSQPDHIQFSGDGHYLAIGCDTSVILVFDIQTGQMIGRCPHSQVPCFLNDSRTLLAMPDDFRDGTFERYQLDNQNLSLLPTSIDYDLHRVGFLAYSPTQFLTYRGDPSSEWHLPAWITEFLKDKIGWTRFFENDACIIKAYENRTGHLLAQFGIRLTNFLRVRLSPDSQLMVIEDQDTLALWDIPPRHSTICWLVCCSVAFLAIWLAWPRKIKAVA